MAKVITLTPALATENARLFESCVIREGRRPEVEAIANTIVRHRSEYIFAGADLDVPWFVVGVIHTLESSNRFDRHLHNGDPLTARTVHVPKGRPRNAPPFTWTESAVDALTLHRLHLVTLWTLPRTLFELERWNGWGYRRYHPDVLSPYLWSGSQLYTRGKYVADGEWSQTAVSKQIGAAVLLKRLVERAVITFENL